MTSKATVTNPEQLFLIFLSPAPFYSNPVRSFLQYLQKSNRVPFKLINFPKDLYTASESLVKDYQPVTPSLQLPDGTQYPVIITITPRQNDSALLNLNLGADTAKQLVGAEANNASITWLKDILCIGARMTRADCGFVSWEAQPHETINARVEYGRLYLEKLPIMLWTTAPLSEAISHLNADAWKTEQQSDGAWLIIPQQLPDNQNTEDKGSLWIDATQTRYFLISNRQELSDGNFPLHNLDGEQKEVAIAKIASYEITQEQATAYLESQINQAIDQAKDALFNQISFFIGKTPETPQQTPTLSELMTVLLGVSQEELSNHPEKAKASLDNLIATFADQIEQYSDNKDESLSECITAVTVQVGWSGGGRWPPHPPLAPACLNGYGFRLSNEVVAAYKIIPSLRGMYVPSDTRSTSTGDPQPTPDRWGLP